jgi:ubiquinone/menaquinone biosynthesis C-methylase UbiE
MMQLDTSLSLETYYNSRMEQKAIFDDFANKYDSWFDTPVGSKVKDLELDLLLGFVKPQQGLNMLEVGIGTGLFAMELGKRGIEIVGIDPSEKMREIAKKRGFDVRYGVGEQIPFPDNTFDVVLSMSSMEFSREPDLFVSEMRRVAKPNGTVVVAVLNLWSTYGISRRVRGIFRRSFFNDVHFYAYGELGGLLSRHLAGVEVSSSVFINPSPPRWLLRKANSLEVFGRKHLKPFGALLVGAGRKVN